MGGMAFWPGRSVLPGTLPPSGWAAALVETRGGRAGRSGDRGRGHAGQASATDQGGIEETEAP